MMTFPIYGNIKNVPNHQPVVVIFIQSTCQRIGRFLFDQQSIYLPYTMIHWVKTQLSAQFQYVLVVNPIQFALGILSLTPPCIRDFPAMFDWGKSIFHGQSFGSPQKRNIFCCLGLPNMVTIVSGYFPLQKPKGLNYTHPRLVRHDVMNSESPFLFKLQPPK